jgi:hypothetical protein
MDEILDDQLWTPRRIRAPQSLGTTPSTIDDPARGPRRADGWAPLGRTPFPPFSTSVLSRLVAAQYAIILDSRL